jgi:hypothetical protein
MSGVRRETQDLVRAEGEELQYEEWETGVPKAIPTDSLWKMKVYRLALFLGDLGWHDVTKLMQDRCTRALPDQLYRAVGSVSHSMSDALRFTHYVLCMI